jgi:NTE family protein
MRNAVLPAIVLALLLPFAAWGVGEKPADRPSVALVLSGGGAKGFAHIPVLELIEELDIPIDIVIANSAGSIVGGLYCAGYSPQDLKDALLDLNWTEFFQDRPDYPFDSELGEHGLYAKPINLKFGSGAVPDFGTGVSTGERAYMLFKTLTAKIPSYIDFDSLPIPFRAVAVNYRTGDLEVLGDGDLAEAIRASISLPAIFDPFPINGKYYLDGVVRNNTPIQQAKDLGYDIIIVVELYGDSPGENQDSGTPSGMSISQVFQIYLNTLNSRQQSYADVILSPNTHGFTMFDFSKARDIYNRGADEKAKFREQLVEVRKKIYPDQYPQSGQRGRNPAARIESDDAEHTFSFVDTGGNRIPAGGRYAKLPDIVVHDIVVHGEVESDRKYIELQFAKLLMDSAVEKENLNEFIRLIYKTGNYLFVVTRIDLRGGNGQGSLELILRQTDHRRTLLLLGVSYQSTMASSSISKLTLSTDFQMRGLTGAGSVLAVGADLVNRTAAKILFMQPFTPGSYTTFSVYIDSDQDFIASGFDDTALSGNRIVTAGVNMDVGFKFSDSHSLRAGAGLVWLNTDNGFTEALSVEDRARPDSRATVAVPVRIDYIFSNLDYRTLPMSGYFVNVVNTAVFPMSRNDVPIAYNVCEVDFSLVIPVGRRFSISASGFAGSDVTQNLQDVPYQIPVFGFNSFDRMYFPHIPGKKLYGTHKGAFRAGLQFQPWDNVTILGGQIIVSTSVSIGELALRYEDFAWENMYWSASCNVGVRINKAFGVQMRFGAGSSDGTVSPFVSFDIGTIRL